MRPLSVIKTLRDGTRQIALLSAPALPKFQHRSKWTVRDAAEMHTLMVRYYASPFSLITLSSMWQHLAPDTTDSEHWEYVRHMAKRLHRTWANPDFTVILAEQDFAEMMKAAAITASNEPLRDDELIAPDGTIFFTEKQNLTGMLDPSAWRASTRYTAEKLSKVRCIQWQSTPGPGLANNTLIVQLMVDGSDVADTPNAEQIRNPDECSFYLSSFTFVRLQPRMKHPADAENENNQLVINLIRSMTAIAKSPQSRETLVSPTAKLTREQQRSRRGRNLTRDIRVLSLQNPEHGRYELDAATGRKIRAHWVRGHWRNQWYASSEEHRTIWIDGFVEGDLELGTVSGAKVYVARAPQEKVAIEGEES